MYRVKTMRKCLEHGLEPPVYGPRHDGRPNKLAPYLDYLSQRIAAFTDLAAVRLIQELREFGLSASQSCSLLAPKRRRDIRPRSTSPGSLQHPADLCSLSPPRSVVDRSQRQ
jgi:hypothetical protein